MGMGSHRGNRTADAPQRNRQTATHAPADSQDWRVQPDDPWRFARSDCDPARAEHDQTLFCLANGSLGVRGGAEEAGGSGGCFLAEGYERSPIGYHERFAGFAAATDTRVPVADGTHVGIRLGEFALDPADPACLEFERVLDLRAGCLRRRALWRCPDGRRIELRAERLVPFGHPGLVALRLCLRSLDYRGPVELVSALRGDRTAPAQGSDPRIGVGSGVGMQVVETGAETERAWLRQATRHGGLRVHCEQRHRITEGPLRCVQAAHGERAVEQRFAGELEPGQQIVIEKYLAYAWARGERGSAAPPLHGVEEAFAAAAEGYAALAAGQAQALAAFWQAAELAIDGDPATEQALRFNLFHLLQSTGRDGRSSAAAKGLTGDGYEGHYFWDTEAFVLPVLALTAPELARGMLMYRFGTLEHARRHAREMNHRRGALYAWRTIGGDECSAYYPGGSAQYHINAAIAYAIRLYMAATDDLDFLAAAGAEMLFETARIWQQAGHFNPRRGGAFCIGGVTGPDEYTALVDNNYYTNKLARAHLRDAAAAWERLGAERPHAREALAAALGLDQAEVAQWRAAAEAMYLPVDAATGLIAQDDGFLDRPRWDFAATPESNYPLLLHYHPLTLYRHQVCKQADVVLALVLDGAGVDAACKRRCYDYYEPLTVHDSTLSASSHGVLASELGLSEHAWTFFQETLRVDLDDLHGNSGHGVHMAALAGSWHCLAFGFAGLRVVEGRLHFAPNLPGPWGGYRLGLRWRGRRLCLAVAPDGVEYRLLDGPALTVFERGEAIALAPGAAVRRPLTEAARWPLLRPPRPLHALIFDLDGVLTDTARVHYHAWKRLAEEIGVEFDERINRRLKGVDRLGSLEILLARAPRPYTPAEKAALAERKNGYYRAQIERFDPSRLLPGALAALEAARRAGLKIGLASASRNAPLLLERLGIAERFDFIADPARIARGKPDPEIFLAAAQGLGVAPAACLGVEDAAAGIAAIKAAGMTALGIGDRRELAAADAVLPGLQNFRVEAVLRPAEEPLAARMPRHVRARCHPPAADPDPRTPKGTADPRSATHR